MKDNRPEQQWWKWSLLASILLNVLAAALILPRSLVSPLKEEQTITVELVQAPPAPPPKPKAEPPKPAVEAPKPKVETPKPKAEAPKPEPKAAASPPVEPEKSPKETTEKPSPSKEAEAPPSPLPSVKPVFLFGDKNQGPRQSLDGNSPENGSAMPSARPEPARQNPPQILSVTTPAMEEVLQGTTAKTPPLEGTAPIQPDAKLHQAKTLFSQDTTNDINATLAMGSMSPSERAGQLCFTELREQLLHASPAYVPEVLPLERHKQGTVIEDSNAAFSSNSQWYDLSYRCEVDAKATKVVAFAFQVGNPVPRSAWKSRGFPSQ